MPQRMCPNCRAFISSADRVCPYCEFELAPAPAPIRRGSQGLSLPEWLPQAHSTTIILLTVNIGLFAATLLYSGGLNALNGLDGMTLTYFGAMHPGLIQVRGDWWRLVTAGFLHGDGIHILMNMLGLWQLGNEVEELFHTARFVSIYLLSSITGFLASYFWGNSLSVGASAGIFGLLGALIAYGVLVGSSAGAAVREYYTRVAVYSILMGLFLSQGRIDHAAHFGGAAGGFGVAWLSGIPSLFDNWREKLARIVCYVSIGITVLAYLRWLLWFFRV